MELRNRARTSKYSELNVGCEQRSAPSTIPIPESRACEHNMRSQNSGVSVTIAEKALMAGDYRLQAILTDIEGVGFELDRQGKVLGIWAGGNTDTPQPPESLLGKSIGIFFGNRTLRDIRAALTRVLESGKGESLVHLQCFAGGQKWYSSHLTPIKTPAGTQQKICLFSRDITDRKLIEGRLAHAEKMEAIGHLAGGISHDFNNLLGIIQGTAEMLSLNLGADHPQHEYVAQLLRSTESATVLTQKLLAFSRQQVRKPTVTDLNKIVTDVQQLVHRVIGEDIVLRTVLDPELYCARVDANEIQRVIMNLVNNARDAMPNGGTIWIQTASAVLPDERLQSPANAAGEYIVLTVRDTGIGMDPTTLTRIFEPFFTTKKNGQGTGLGLASVCGIVRQSAGFINASSDPGKGSCFQIYLPAVTGRPTLLSAAPVTTVDAPLSETVLLVEDSKELRSLLKEMMEAAGLNVVEASTAEEALRLVAQYPGTIDLLITDMVMPGLSGQQLARRLKQICPKLRVLYMSGYADVALKARGNTTPSEFILSKPFTQSTLLQRVAQSLRRPQSSAPGTSALGRGGSVGYRLQIAAGISENNDLPKP
jgi:two-component system, cell cycle sensor histidine kinase and response regulator CckA